nr:PREDICTED: cathepsin L1-like [Bemisia tabaci]
MSLLGISVVLAVLGGSFCSDDVRRTSSERLERSAIKDDFATDLDDIALNLDLHFEDFKMKFKRKYKSIAEEQRAFRNFLMNIKEARELQASEMGTAKYGVTDMFDMSVADFLTRRANLNPTGLEKGFERLEEVKSKRFGENPKALDWRLEGKVTRVKDQEQCGSCWAFSVTGQLEAANLITNPNSTLTTFSEQQLVDCDPESAGCFGGWMEYALDYAMGAGGLESDTTYPYEAKNGACRFNSSRVVVRVTGNKKLPQRNDKAIEDHVANVGPVSAAINAKLLQYYKGGIIKQPIWKCWNGDYDVNHAVVIVGYGVGKIGLWNVPYWIIKNSWGSNWGENGYARIARRRNQCGIENWVNAAEVEKLS